MISWAIVEDSVLQEFIRSVPVEYRFNTLSNEKYKRVEEEIQRNETMLKEKGRDGGTQEKCKNRWKKIDGDILNLRFPNWWELL